MILCLNAYSHGLPCNEISSEKYCRNLVWGTFFYAFILFFLFCILLLSTDSIHFMKTFFAKSDKFGTVPNATVTPTLSVFYNNFSSGDNVYILLSSMGLLYVQSI